MHLIDLTHTAHTRVQTGIQVVCRALYGELAERQAARPITWDRYAGEWRGLEAWEYANLSPDAGRSSEHSGASRPESRSQSTKRSARWPLHARWRGRWRALRKWLGSSTGAAVAAQQLAAGLGDAEKSLAAKHLFSPDTVATKATLTQPKRSGLIVPELFNPSLTRHSRLFQIPGPKIAIFHDAIPLKLPELSPAKTVALFPGYLHALLQFDGIAANSEDSAQTLRDYFRWLGAPRTPQVIAIPLGVSLPTALPAPPSPQTAGGPLPTILTVGSIEGRKNHLALLDAVEMLWAKGRQFRLHIIGLAQSETGRVALEKIAALQAAGRPLFYAGHAARSAVEAAYAQCAFTVYPSLAEGFGLPVIESLARGRPCICSGGGALGEVSRGGGALSLDEMNAPNIANAIDTLLQSPEYRAKLAAEARFRRFRNWADYTSELLNWMDTLPPHSR